MFSTVTKIGPRRLGFTELKHLILLVAGATALMGQTKGGQEKSAHFAFEAVSAKVNNSGATDFNAQMAADRYVATNVPLRRLIRDAYGLRVFQIQNLPSWDPGQRFDINAKMPPNTGRAELPAMLQDLLTTRFGLVLRREMKEVTVYSLVLGKGGPKLGNKIAGAADRRVNINPGVIKGNATMTELAAYLGADLESMVTDNTGVEGVYAIDLKYIPESVAGAPLPPAAGAGPSVFEVVETLGLKLDRQKGMIPYYFVERVLKVPTEN